MEAVADGFSVVVVGAWNAAIFSPDWITGRLTKANEVGMEIAVNNPALPPRFVFDEVFLRLLPDRFILNPQEVRDDLLTRMEEIAAKTLNDLPHTPVRAVGVNFRFLERNPEGRLLEAFQLTDQGYLADAGAIVGPTSIRRGLTIGERKLNLTLEFKDSGQVMADLNFHQDVSDAEAAQRYLGGEILEFRRNATELLQSVYELTENEESE